MATTLPKSLKAGTTAQARALVFEALAATIAPTTIADMQAMVGVNEKVDILAAETGGQICRIAVWWFYPDAGPTWVKDVAVGDVTVTANGTAGIVTVPSAATGIHIQVVSVIAGAKITAWAVGRDVHS